MPPDGNWLAISAPRGSSDPRCSLFAAVADQLALANEDQQLTAHDVRHATADYMKAHKDDFIFFLPSDDTEDGLMSDGADCLAVATRLILAFSAIR
jgi:hypothetical protein